MTDTKLPSGDLQKLDIQIYDSEMITHILSNPPE